jgi:hypothetical protein
MQNEGEDHQQTVNGPNPWLYSRKNDGDSCDDKQRYIDDYDGSNGGVHLFQDELAAE